MAKKATKIIYGKYLITDFETLLPSGALYIEDDTIVDAGPYGQITAAYRADELIGSSEHLVIPGLINAHSHGKGLTDFQLGQIDDTLETWKFRAYPPVDAGWDTLWNIVRHLECGVTTTMHIHNLMRPEKYAEEYEAVLQAYIRAGTRVAFSPTLSTENPFVYGDNDRFIRSLPSGLQAVCRGIVDRSKLFGEEEYFQTLRNLLREYGGPRTRIMHGPLAPQWVRDEALQEIARQAEELDLRIHLHCQQTQLQNLYGYKTYGKSLIAHLDDLGILGPRLTCGHCVWISKEDIRLLAGRQTSVTHHASCNLRVRNGIAPVFALLRQGVPVAIGMDDKELGDDKDFIEEMRLVSKMHRQSSHRLDSVHLKPNEVFRMATEHGARVLGFQGKIGRLAPGMQADIVLLDLTRMQAPFCYEDHHPLELLLYRGRSIDVDTVLVAGKVLLRERQLTGIDREECLNKLKESVPGNYTEAFRKSNTHFPALRARIADWFEPWFSELEQTRIRPFYSMNNQTNPQG